MQCCLYNLWQPRTRSTGPHPMSFDVRDLNSSRCLMLGLSPCLSSNSSSGWFLATSAQWTTSPAGCRLRARSSCACLQPPSTRRTSTRFRRAEIAFSQSLNFCRHVRDLLLLQGKYAIQPPVPAVAGNEGVGEIEAVGSGVTCLSVGVRVPPSLLRHPRDDPSGHPLPQPLPLRVAAAPLPDPVADVVVPTCRRDPVGPSHTDSPRLRHLALRRRLPRLCPHAGPRGHTHGPSGHDGRESVHCAPNAL